MTTAIKGIERPRVEGWASGVRVAWSLVDRPFRATRGEDIVATSSFAGRGADGGNWVVGMGAAAEWIWPSSQQRVSLGGEEFDPQVLPYLGFCLWIAGSFQKTGFALGERVLILGMGVLGQLAIQWARLSGARKIVASDTGRWGEEWAIAYGSDAFVPLSALAEGGGEQDRFDLLVDTSGNADWLVKGLSLLPRGGRALLLGDGYGLMDFNFYAPVHTRSLALIGGQMPIDSRQVLGFIEHLLASPRLQVETLSVQCLTLGEERKADVEDGVGGLLVRWNTDQATEMHRGHRLG